MSESCQSSTTLDSTLDCFLLNVKRDGANWIVSEHETTVYGYGPTLLEAMTDFHAALRSHLAVRHGDTITPRLQRQKQRILWMLGVAPSLPLLASTPGEAALGEEQG
jgi:hypothetical protein